MNRCAKGVLLSLCGFVNSANAGSSNDFVTHINIYQLDVVMFAAGTHHGKPACSVEGEDWALSLTTTHGKAMYTLLLSAQAQGKQVVVTGNATCNAWSDREEPSSIDLLS